VFAVVWDDDWFIDAHFEVVDIAELSVADALMVAASVSRMRPMVSERGATTTVAPAPEVESTGGG
jgi:hypothetical protein